MTEVALPWTVSDCCAARRESAEAGGLRRVQRAELGPGDAHDVVVVAVGGGPAGVRLDRGVALAGRRVAQPEVVAQLVGDHRGDRVPHVQHPAARRGGADLGQRVGAVRGGAAHVEHQVPARAGHEADRPGDLVPHRRRVGAAGDRGDPVAGGGDADGDGPVALLGPEAGDRPVDDVDQLLGGDAVRGHPVGGHADDGDLVGQTGGVAQHRGRGRGRDDLAVDERVQRVLGVAVRRVHGDLHGRPGGDALDVLGGDADGVAVGVLHPADRALGLGRPALVSGQAWTSWPTTVVPAGWSACATPGTTTAAATAAPTAIERSRRGRRGRTGQKASPSASAVPARVGTVGGELSGTPVTSAAVARSSPGSPVRRARRPPSGGGRPR